MSWSVPVAQLEQAPSPRALYSPALQLVGVT